MRINSNLCERVRYLNYSIYSLQRSLGRFRRAIPSMPLSLAVLCFLSNVFIPGLGEIPILTLSLFLSHHNPIHHHTNISFQRLTSVDITNSNSLSGTLLSSFSLISCADGAPSHVFINILCAFLQLITAPFIVGVSFFNPILDIFSR